MTRSYLVATFALSLSCRRAPPPQGPAPRLLVGVSASREFTSISANFYAERDLAYRDRECLGVRLRDGREPASQEAGRVEAFVVNGPVLGHADPRDDGVYLAAVRAVLPPGTEVSARIAGTNTVPAHTFHTPARVPEAVRVLAPTRGFSLARGEALTVRWQGGNSGSVMIRLDATSDAAARGEGWSLSCVAERARGQFTLPAAGLREGLVPASARRVTLVVSGDERVREGDYAIDVTPVGREEDVIVGELSSPAPTR